MRHRAKTTHLNRDSNHRQALYRNLLTSLIEYGAIRTTNAKAKAIQGQFDKLMTKAKRGTLHDRRLIHQVLPKRTLVNRLVDLIAPLASTRTSGFTRITKLAPRRGDNTLVVKLELVDKPAVEIKARDVKSKDVVETPKTSAETKSKTAVTTARVKPQAQPQTPLKQAKPVASRSQAGSHIKARTDTSGGK